VEGKKATLATNTEGQKVIKISFPYDLDIIKEIRELPGRKYHKDLRCWSAPIFPKTVNELIKLGFTVDEKITNMISGHSAKLEKIMSDGVDGLKRQLRPFQSQGVTKIDIFKGRALLADEMGLGKTIMALAWLQMHKDLRPVIVVVPSNVKINWMREAKLWMTNPNVEILSGETPWKPSGSILVINYEVLHHWVLTLRRQHAKVLICDEAHYIKSNKARRTKAVRKLAKGIDYIQFLTGTPIENRPIEMFNMLNILYPEIFPNWFFYGKRYCKGKNNGFGWDFSGHSHEDELHNKLINTCMIRRLKKDVLKELPDKIPSFLPFEIDNQKEYEYAEKHFIQYIRALKGDKAAMKAKKVEQMASLESLKQLAVKGKLKQSIAWIRDFIESGEKLVVFATHHIVVDALMEEFKGMAVQLDGRVTSDIARQKAVDDFQLNPDIKIFIGNIKAAGKAITLTAASNVAILELPWTPGSLKQAIDRVHRMGQLKGVNVWYHLALNTIEEKLVRILDTKQKVSTSVIDGGELSEDDVFTLLINQYLI
jgi:SWI/SNF-related matrix-associated actin-dependent regulator 1 of chromatin subfamily A